jgi:hypothetical protein
MSEGEPSNTRGGPGTNHHQEPDGHDALTEGDHDRPSIRNRDGEDQQRDQHHRDADL